MTVSTLASCGRFYLTYVTMPDRLRVRIRTSDEGFPVNSMTWVPKVKMKMCPKINVGSESLGTISTLQRKLRVAIFCYRDFFFAPQKKDHFSLVSCWRLARWACIVCNSMYQQQVVSSFVTHTHTSAHNLNILFIIVTSYVYIFMHIDHRPLSKRWPQNKIGSKLCTWIDEVKTNVWLFISSLAQCRNKLQLSPEVSIWRRASPVARHWPPW